MKKPARQKGPAVSSFIYSLSQPFGQHLFRRHSAMRSSRIIRHSDAARAFACRFFLKMVKMNLYFLYASHILAQPQPRRSQSLQGQSTVIPYTFVPPKALSLLITASNKCQTNQQYNERYSKIDREVIHVTYSFFFRRRAQAAYVRYTSSFCLRHLQCLYIIR
jgi:hypothetical protein